VAAAKLNKRRYKVTTLNCIDSGAAHIHIRHAMTLIFDRFLAVLMGSSVTIIMGNQLQGDRKLAARTCHEATGRHCVKKV